MFKLISFERRLCDLGNSYDFIADACRNKDDFFSYLNFRTWSGYLKADAFFYLYYWFVLILGLCGTVHSIYRFTVVFSKEVNTSTLWDHNRFHILTPAYARRWNLVKSFIQTNAWALLLYAGFFVSPPHMYPWLLVQALKLFLKVIAAFLDYILGCLDGIRTTLNLIVLALSTWLVYQAMQAFSTARLEDTP